MEVLRAEGLAAAAAHAPAAVGSLFLHAGVVLIELPLGAEHGVAVEGAEHAGDVHAGGTGHAVLAAGAADAHARLVDLAHAGHHPLLVLGQAVGLGLVKDGQVVEHLLAVGHAGEDGNELGLVVEVAERPLDRTAPDRLGGVQLEYVGGYVGRQRAAAQGLHDDQTHALLAGNLGRGLQGGLVELVQHVHLDLRHVPVIVPRDALEGGAVVVEGEADMADLALGEHVCEEARIAERLDLVVARAV